jgi:hypothetical protein
VRTSIAVLLATSLVGCGAPQSPWPQPPSGAVAVQLTLSRDVVPLLGEVEANFDLYTADGVEAEFAPTLPATEFAVRREELQAVPLDGGLWRRVILRLRPLRGPGELTIPAFEAKSKDGKHVATTAERRLQIVSLLDGADAAIEAPAAPFDLRDRGWWPLGLGATVVAAAAAAFLLRRRARAPEPAAVAVPAHVRALRELHRLRSAPRTGHAEVQAFYVAVSTVLREYVEARFGLHAPERTTEEFLRELERGAEQVRAHRDELAEFLRRCDLVKFAADRPDQAAHEATLALAERFVESTRIDGAEGPSA